MTLLLGGKFFSRGERYNFVLNSVGIRNSECLQAKQDKPRENTKTAKMSQQLLFPGQRGIE